MCYVHQQLFPENDLSMKIGSERYVGVTSIKLNFGEITPAYHCITERDTTSYPANVGKVRPFQKLIQKQAFHLLKNLRSHINLYKDVVHAKKYLSYNCAFWFIRREYY